MATLTKADLSEALFNEVGLSKRESKELVDIFFEKMAQFLEQGHSIKLSGFGNFELRDKTARPGRNPRTGEDALITARRVVTFRAGQKLRAQVETYTGNADKEQEPKDER